jgi:hypothetical protein
VAPASRRPRIYLCATEWLGLLNGEPGARDVQALIDRASKGAFDVVGSELLYVEVLATGSEELLAAGVRTWAALDHRVAMKVREYRLRALSDSRPIKNMTPDIIHIATAAVADVEAFITSDGACRSLAAYYGLPAYDRGQFPEGELPV